MTKYKCDNCGEKHDRIHIIIECSNCYVKGWKKQWKQDRDTSSTLHALKERLFCTECNKELFEGDMMWRLGFFAFCSEDCLDKWSERKNTGKVNKKLMDKDYTKEEGGEK